MNPSVKIPLFILFWFLLQRKFGVVNSQDFGDVIEQSNSNTRLIGNGNRGQVISNSNINVESYSTTLDLQSNSNCNFFFRNCQVNMRSESNVNVRIEDSSVLNTRSNSHVSIIGTGLTGLVESNSQTDITATNCVLTIKNNSNCNIRGRNKTLNVQNQSNCNINGRDGKIWAFSNANLSVLGDGHNVRISNTSNHALLVAKEGDEAQEFRIQVRNESKGPRSRHDEVPYNVLLKYKDSADIVGNRYRVGRHTFELARKDANSLVLKLIDFGSDQGLSMKSSMSEPSAVIVTSNDSSANENLMITGPSTSWENNEVLILLS